MIFVLGGNGFVGSGFARVLEAQGREYAVITRENYQQYVGQRCDVFINANGNSRKMMAKEQPLAEFDASVRSVRSSLVDFKFDQYVFLSSCDVYPDCSSPESTRESVAPDISLQSPYGFHKHLAEQCVRHAAGRWLVVRMGGFVGPGMRKNAIFDILYGNHLWLDPESELQFMHTDRNAELILGLLDQGVRNEVINVCGKGLVKLRDAMTWAGRELPVAPGSPKVRYEVGIAKLEALVTVPDTSETVRRFITEAVKQGGERQ